MFVFTWDSRLGSSTRDLERSRLAFSSLSLTTFYIIGRSLHLHLMLRPFSCHWVFFQNHLSYLFLSENKPWATRLAPHGRSFGDPRAPPCQQFIAIIGSFLCFLCFFLQIRTILCYSQRLPLVFLLLVEQRLAHHVKAKHVIL